MCSFVVSYHARKYHVEKAAYEVEEFACEEGKEGRDAQARNEDANEACCSMSGEVIDVFFEKRYSVERELQEELV